MEQKRSREKIAGWQVVFNMMNSRAGAEVAKLPAQGKDDAETNQRLEKEKVELTIELDQIAKEKAEQSTKFEVAKAKLEAEKEEVEGRNFQVVEG